MSRKKTDISTWPVISNRPEKEDLPNCVQFTKDVIEPEVRKIEKELATCKKEAVNHPDHYNAHNIEVIEITDDWDLNFDLGNCVKYILRAPYKNNTLEDLKKAQWYLNHEIEKLEKKEGK